MDDAGYSLNEQRQNRMLDRIDEILRIRGEQEGLRCRGDVLFLAIEDLWREVLSSRSTSPDRHASTPKSRAATDSGGEKKKSSVALLISLLLVSYLAKPVLENTADGQTQATGQSRACACTGAPLGQASSPRRAGHRTRSQRHSVEPSDPCTMTPLPRPSYTQPRRGQPPRKEDTTVITHESIDVPESRVHIDPATQEWLEFFEGPSVPLLANGLAVPPVATDPAEPFDARTADWRSTERFPVVPLLQGSVRSARTSAESDVRRPERKFPSPPAPRGSGFASNLVIRAMLRSGGDFVVVQQV
jgi:hypothetical protein